MAHRGNTRNKPLRRPTYLHRLWVALAKLSRKSRCGGGKIPESEVLKQVAEDADEYNEKLGKRWEDFIMDAIRTAADDKHKYIERTLDGFIRVKKSTRVTLSDIRHKLDSRIFSSPTLFYRTFCSLARRNFGSIKYITKAELAEQCDGWRMKYLMAMSRRDEPTTGDEASSYAGSIWTASPATALSQSVAGSDSGSFIDDSNDVTMVEQEEFFPCSSTNISPARKSNPIHGNPLPTPPDSNVRQRPLAASNSFTLGALPPSPSSSHRSISPPHSHGPSGWDNPDGIDDMDIDEGHRRGLNLATQLQEVQCECQTTNTTLTQLREERDTLQTKYDDLEVDRAGLQRDLEVKTDDNNRLSRLVSKLFKALRGERLTIFTLLGKVAESRQEIRDSDRKLRMAAELKHDIVLVEKKYDGATKELVSLRETISALKTNAESVAPLQEEVNNLKKAYLTKNDECMALREKLAAHGTTLRALGLAMEAEGRAPVEERQEWKTPS